MRVREEGIDAIDKKLTTLEKRLGDDEKRWNEFADKKFPKQTKAIKKELTGISEVFGKITESQEKWTKSAEDGAKRQVKGYQQTNSMLGKLSQTLGKVQGQVDKFNKTGLSLDASLSGGEDTLNTLGQITDALDRLRSGGGEVKLTMKIYGADDVIEKLQTTEGLVTRLNDNGTVTITTNSENVDRLNESLTQAVASRDSLRDQPLEVQVDSSSVTDLTKNLGDSESSAGRVRDVIGGSGGRDRNSVRGALQGMSADAKAAEALPSLLGDLGTQLAKFKVIAAGVAAATIPVLIAVVGGLGTAIAVAGAGVGALATGLGIGLVGAAAQVGTAMGAAGAAVAGAGYAMNAAIANTLGLGKAFGSFTAEAKFAQDLMKGVTALLKVMPAGTDAARVAQERFNIVLEYGNQVTAQQVDWYNRFGDASNELLKSFLELRLGMAYIVSTAGGMLIPVIQDFVDIAIGQLPNVALAFEAIVKGVTDGTASLREFLASSQGFSEFQGVIEAIGRAAYPTFKGLADGAILALGVMQPVLDSGQDILVNLQELITAAAEWSQTAEGMQAINDAWALAFDYSERLGTSVVNLGAALGNLGRAFISSGLVDQMLNGFVSMTASIRDFTATAQDADSEFSKFLNNAGPILTSMGDALGEIVRQGLRAVGAIADIRNEATGTQVLVEIFDAIRDSASDMADLLINTFEDLGPVIADLIPNLAEFFKIFLGSTPELVLFLGFVNDLLTAFNALPDPVQMVIARFLAYSTIVGMLAGSGGGGVLSLVTSLGTLYTQFKVLQALEVPTLFSGIAAAVSSAAFYIQYAGLVAYEAVAGFAAMIASTYATEGAFAAAAVAAEGFMVAMGPILLLAAAAIAITVVVYFDMDAAKQAYADARASGETVGNSVAEGVLAGLDAVPIVGSVTRWVDTNIAQPIANFVQKLEPGGEFDGILGRWLAEQTGIDIPAVADWIDRNIRTPIDNFFANFQSGGQWNGILGGWAMEEFGAIRDAVNDQFTNGAVADFIAADASLGEDASIKWDEVNAKIGEILTAIWQDVTNSYQDGAIADFIAADASLGDDVSVKWDEVNAKIGEVLAAIWADVTASYQDGAIADFIAADASLGDDVNAVWDAVSAKIGEVLAAIWQDVINSYQDGAIAAFIAADASLGDDVNAKWDEVLTKIGEVLTSIWNKVIESYQDGAIADFIAADASLGDDVHAVWPEIESTIASAMSGIYDAIVSKITSARDEFVNAINVMKGAAASVMTGLGMGNLARSIGLSGAGGGGTANMPAQRAKGGIDKNAQAQGSTGGVASGLTPRVVYGEQQRRVKEAYIVEDRPDNLPYLQEAASWYGMGLYPVEGMARGGVRHRGGGRRGGRGGARRDIGKKWNQVKHFGGRKHKRKKKGHRGGSGTGGTGTTGTTGTGGGTSTTTNTSADTASSDSLNQSVDSSGTPTSGGTNQCGVFPVSSATPSDQVPFADAARDQFGLTSVPANPSTTGADHVNVPEGIPGGDLCGANGGGSVPSTFPSNPMTPSGSSGTSTDPWQQCGPSFAMASGGVMGADGAVRPIPYTSVPLDPWRQFLGLSWYGDPTLDWPELVPPAGYDPTQLYGDPSSPTMPFAKGGILRSGTRYFQAGGLNQAQMDAGLAAGNSALGAFYSYGSAGEDGGYDCAGIWNYIESAIVYGAPQTGKRWGTYDAAAGAGGSFTTPGLSPGGANIGVNLSGEGGPDDTHMAGDILNTPFESDTFNGVHNGRGADSFGTQYTMGGAADMASQLPAPAPVDPAGNIQGEVGDWWNCATQPAMPTGSSPTSSPINPWDSALPGMAQDYLTNVGMGTIGSLGSGATPTGSGVRDWIIAALNASGMDASEEAISTLEGLIMQESGGDPSATSPDGAMGIAQLMPDTWAAYNQGGDPYEPVANIVASIAYQLARYGTLVEFSPYAKGGMATGPHLGLLGETGNNEVMLPLGHRRVMSEVQATVGTAGLTEGLMALGDEIRAVKGELAHQTRVMPERTGVAVGGGVDRRIARNPGTRIAFDRQQDTRDKINNYRGTPV